MPSPVSGGAAYDLASGTWSKLDTAGAPIARRSAHIVWTGSEAIIWGGSDGFSKRYADGGIFHP